MADLRQELAALSPERRRLVELLLRQEAQAEEPATSRIPPRRPADRCPLSFAQLPFWLAQQWDPDTSAYNFPIAVRLRGPCDVVTLGRSLQALVRRHAVLRTTFVELDGQPEQAIAPAAHIPLLLLDLAHLPGALREQQLAHLAIAESRSHFDLARGPLLRVCILRLGAAEHALLITLHHIIFDDWSQGVFVRELFALYAALRAGRFAPLPPLPIQYADYAAWQRQAERDAAQDAHLAFWSEHLRGAPTLLDLPTDQPRPPLRSTHGANQLFTLPAPLAEALKALSRQAGATLFMTLLAAFNVLLARYSGQDDIVVGTPIAGRTRDELEGLIGLFMTMLPLRTSLAGNPSFRELARRVRAVAVGVYAHQDVALEQILEALAIRRDPSVHPLFQVIVALQNAPMPALAGAELTVEPLEVLQNRARYDVGLFLREGAEGLRGRLEYRTELFSSATIQRMCGHFLVLLEGIVSEPDERVGALPLLSAAQRAQVLVEWNDTTLGDRGQGTGDRTIQGLFAAQAARRPDAIAVVFDPTNDEGPTTKDEDSDSSFVVRRSSSIQLTYSELERRSNQLAHHLRGLGVGPEALVGICLERSLEMVVALLGVLKAGGAYLPLDPTYPSERISFMLEDSGATALVTNDERRRTKDERRRPDVRPSSFVNLQAVDLRADWPAIARQPEYAPESGLRSDNLAYVIYTSGSTGRPKGVPIPHRALTNFLRAMRERPGLADDDALLSVTTLSFDIAALEIFLPLVVGARVVLVERSVVADGARLATALRDCGATAMQATPATWRLLLASGWRGQRGLSILCGGEALPTDLAAKLRERCAALWNMYGPTETTIWSLLAPIRERRASIPIGRPIANTQAYVLDRCLRPAPPGVVGELYIGGVQLARGYLGRPDLTAAAFVPNPFVLSEDERRKTKDEGFDSSFVVRRSSFVRLYKTGDLARYSPDGAIEYLGRVDGQVKLRGYRIELGEIEAALAQHAQIHAAVALVREDAPGERRLVAYVVPTNDEGRTTKDDRRPTIDDGSRSEPSSIVHRLSSSNGESEPSSFALPGALWASGFVTELRSFLAERLPSYMIPAAFVLLDALPLTPNGKIDRRVLPPPDATRAAPAAAFVAPRTPLEQQLAAIWSQVLGVQQVGAHDNFFELGGDSLLILRVVSGARQAGIALSARLFFRHPTVAQLAAAIGEEAPAPQAEGLIAAGPASLSEAIAGTVRQSRLPISPIRPAPRDRPLPLSYSQEWMWSHNDSPLKIHMVLRCAVPLDLAALQRSIGELVRRHEALRTTLPLVDGRPVQLIAPARAVRLPVLDLRALPQTERMDVALGLAGAEIQRPFDLQRGPLFRTRLLRLDEAEHLLIFVAHHIIFDGWSMGILGRELSMLYAGYSTGQPVALAEPGLQYADYAYWQRQWMRGEVLEQHLSYWRQKLAHAPPILGSREIRSLPSATLPFQLVSSLAAELHALSRREGSTLFITLLAGFKALLASYTGQYDVVLSCSIANRDQVGTHETIGFFANTLLLRTDLSGDLSLLEVLRRVRAGYLEDYDYQHLPIEKMFEVKIDYGQAFFNYMPGTRSLGVRGVQFKQVQASPGSATMYQNLLLTILDDEGSLSGSLSYTIALFDLETVQNLVKCYIEILTAMVQRPEIRLGSFRWRSTDPGPAHTRSRSAPSDAA